MNAKIFLMSNARPASLLVAATMLLAGCSFSPVYERPASPVGPQWSGASTAVPGTEVSSAATLDWQSFVTDERLRGLIQKALDNNRDLRQTLLNVEAARSMYRVERSHRLPSIDAQAGGTRQRLPGDQSTTGQSQVQGSWQAGIGLAAFELDLFGRVRNLSDAALQEYLATEAAARSAQISLVAEVIQAYLTRDGAQQRHELTKETMQSRQGSLALIEQRRASGVASALDYHEALGLTEQAKADLERIEREVLQATNALELLVGEGSAAGMVATEHGRGTLLVQNLAAGTPSELLSLRPDIQAAENRLKARNANIGAARAAFFPRITLTGMFGSSSADLSNLFDSGQRAWSFRPQITLPIFTAGRNQANLNLAEVRKEIAVADYEKTIQTAFREVSDSLVATSTLWREEQAQMALTKSSAQALKLSEARYRGGVDGYLRYLDAQRRDFATQTALINVRTQRQVALATLFRSLGGGWLGSNQLGQGQDPHASAEKR